MSKLGGVWLAAMAALLVAAGGGLAQESRTSELAAQSASDLIRQAPQASRAQNKAIVQELMQRRTEAKRELRAALVTGTEEEKKFAARLIGQIRDTESVPELIRMSQGSAGILKTHALNALREVGGPEAANHLREAISGGAEDENVLVSAVYGLGAIGTKGDGELIRPFLKSQSLPVKAAAASALAQLGSDESQELLIALSRTEEPFVQKLAIKSLAYLDTAPANARLIEIKNDPSAAWRNYALIALEEKQNRKLPSETGRIDHLAGLARNPNRFVSEWATEELSLSDHPRARQALAEIAAGGLPVSEKARYRMMLRGEVTP
jgi:HEAT repeat protein